MDPHIIFRRRSAQRCRYSPVGSHADADGTERCRGRTLHGLVGSALGGEAIMEPVHRPAEDKALVGAHDAAAHGQCAGRHCLHAAHVVLVPGHDVLPLRNGVRQCYARHLCRRLLYDRARRAQPSEVRRTAQYVLPTRRHLRERCTRIARRHIRTSTEYVGGLHLDTHLLRARGALHRHLALPLPYDAASCRRC